MPGRLGVDAQDWAVLGPLLDEALDLPAAQREAWLDALPQACAAYRERLRGWLAQDGSPRLETLPKIADATLDGSRPHDERRPGDTIGPYRIVERLGAGGMGVVWRAERADGLIDRPVALKLPRASTRRGAEIAARMARERQFLATLVHPHIARLYEVGLTDEGQPWMALEHVDGQRIDRHCDERALGFEARLRLFLQAAEAVAHAHARLVAHRDLKPSNILVTREGEVRLLDFGIAGALGDTVEPGAGGACTPGYAAPEQQRGEPAGVAADVYSLGVVLHELLCGARPDPARRAHQVAAATGQPWHARLVGDLDAVLAAALQPDAARRCPTVQALADDLQRVLDRRPVAARPAPAGHRMALFVRRHARGVAAGAVAVAALCATTAVSVAQWQRAEAERRQAVEVRDFVLATLQHASPYVSGSRDAGLPAMLVEARSRLDRAVHTAAATRVELLDLIAWNQASLGQLDAATATLAQARREPAAALPASHPQHRVGRLTEAVIARQRGDHAAARRLLDPLLRELHAQADEAPDTLIRALRNSANIAMHEGAHARALAEAREARSLSARRYGEVHNDTLASDSVLAMVALAAGEPREALEVARRAEGLAAGLFGEAPNARTIEVRATLARALMANGEGRAAVAMLERCLADAVSMHGPDSFEAALHHRSLAAAWLELGEAARARAHADPAWRLFVMRGGRDSDLAGDALVLRARAELAAGRGPAALPDLDEALRIRRLQSGVGHARTAEVEGLRSEALAACQTVAAAGGDVGCRTAPRLPVP